MRELLASIAAKYKCLDVLSLVSREALLALHKSYDVYITYARSFKGLARRRPIEPGP